MDILPPPIVSVIMTVYNGEHYLHDAVKSILNQNFVDFEFIIIDDGSTDQTAEILAHYATQDSRIVFVQNEANIGMTRSLNRALSLARGQYIARMDADDISLPHRLAKQVSYMDTHPQIGICGTWTESFGLASRYWRPSPEDAMIKSELFFDSALAHPTVMIRRRVLIDHDLQYDPNHRIAQDFALWAEAAKLTSFANLPEVLLYYRSHSDQSSSASRSVQFVEANQVRLRQLARLNLDLTDQEREFHLKVAILEPPLTTDFVNRADAWLQRIQAANQIANAFPEPAFSERLSLQWFYICRSMANLSMSAWHVFRNSPLAQSNKIKFASKMKFLLLCAFSPLRRSLNRTRRNPG